MADEVSDGVGFAGAGRALNQDASMLFQLLRDANLLRVGGLAQQNVHAILSHRVFVRFRLYGLFIWNRRFFANNIKERPRKVLAETYVGENAFNRGGITQRSGPQKDDRVSTDTGIELFTARRAFFDEFAARRKLHHHALEEIRRGSVIS